MIQLKANLIKYKSSTHRGLIEVLMDSPWMTWRLSASPLLSFVFLGDEAQFLFGDVEAGTVTPGITGRLAGGVLAKGD